MREDIDILAKTEVLLEALPYIQRFRGSVFTVKFGGGFMDGSDPAVSESVATDMAFLAAVGIHVVVVHGGGKAATRAMEAAGLPVVFNHGLRVTDAAAVQVVADTLNEEVNARICAQVRKKNGAPQRMNGYNVFICEKLKRDEEGRAVDLGFVGNIRHVKTKLIKKALAEGRIPVISCLAQDDEGRLYNTNADLAAAHTAAALRARRLVFLCDVPGLLRRPEDPESLISSLRVDEIEGLKKAGVIARGMTPKVDGGVRALQGGVHRVHFVDGRIPHSILLEIFTDKGVGTEIVAG